MDTTTSPNKNEKDGLWFINLLGLLFFLGLAWWSYNKITGFEVNGGFLSLPKPLMLLYDAVGKWGVVGAWLAFALYNLVKGSISIIKNRAVSKFL